MQNLQKTALSPSGAMDDFDGEVAVTDWNSNSTTCSYDDAGRMTTTTLPSGTGTVSTYTYDDADRLTDIAHVKGGSTTVASVAYTLDDVGTAPSALTSRARTRMPTTTSIG